MGHKNEAFCELFYSGIKKKHKDSEKVCAGYAPYANGTDVWRGCGKFRFSEVAGVPADLKKKFFTKIGPSYQISEEVKERVEFKEHNLLKDTYPTDYHLIVCRNVLIYFTEEAKDEVFRKFQKSLKPGGYLFIGSTEQIINHREVGFERKNSFFYQRPL